MSKLEQARSELTAALLHINAELDKAAIEKNFVETQTLATAKTSAETALSSVNWVLGARNGS